MIRYSSAREQNVLRTGHPLSNEQIGSFAPAVFAPEAHASRSDRYGYIDTGAILNGLRDEGFQVMEARQAVTRTAGKRGYAQHLLRLRHQSVQAFSEGAPEIIVSNSHEGSSAMTIMGGYFRFICSNGLIAGDMLATHKVYHRGSGRLDGMVIDGCVRVLDDVQQITNTIDRWTGTTVTRELAFDYANRALALRWDSGQAPVQAADLLRARRLQDRGNTAWHLLNIVQENLLRGGQPGRNANGGRTTTRAISGMDQTVDINRRLWDLVDEVVAH